MQRRHRRVIDLARVGRHGRADVWAQRGGVAQPLGDAHAGNKTAQVGLGSEVARVDGRRFRRVGTGKTDVTPAVRLQELHPQGHTVSRWRCQAPAQQRHRKPDKLKIGGGQSRVAADEGDRLVHAGSQHPATREQEPDQLGRGVGREECDRLRAVNDDPAGQVVLQVRADTHQVVARLHASGTQLVGIADARQHEQLRRVHRASADDDLAGGGHPLGHTGGIPVLHASGTGPVEQNPLDVSPGEDGQVAAPPGGA